MENCFIVARQAKIRTGFSYMLETKKGNTYILYIKGILNTGDYAKIICESSNGTSIEIGDYLFKLNESKDYKIPIVGNGSSIIVSLIFNNNLYNNFFVDYCIIFNEKNIVSNKINFKPKISTMITQSKGSTLINTYERLKLLKNAKFIIVDEKNADYIKNLFEGYIRIILIDTKAKNISFDNKTSTIIISELYKNLFFELINGEGYYIKI